MIVRNVIAPLLSASLVLPCVALSSRAEAAQASPLPLSMAARTARVDTTVTSVLGLRSDDKKAGEALTAALRSAFAERDMSGGEELSLEEVILTLDCSSEEDTACMTEAGRALAMERLVYGTLTPSGGGYVLDIIVLDVTGGQIEAQATMPLDNDALTASSVGGTAREVVESLYPSDDGAVVASPTEDTTTPEPSDDEADEDEGGGLLWGPYKPRPTWKKVGLGVSAALTVAGIAGGIGTWIYGGRNFTKVANQLPPQREVVGYCREVLDEANANNLPEGDPRLGQAYNCRSGLRSQTWNRVSIAVAVAGGVGTVLFTILHFVHKDGNEAKERANRRGFRILAGPTNGGGLVGGMGRF